MIAKIQGLIIYRSKTPRIIQRLFPSIVWKGEHSDGNLYLTFDDGPIPEVTEWVLDQLEKYGICATFFCIGDNVRKHPEIYNRIIEKGHMVGNHTYDHLKGWSVSTEKYLSNVEKASKYIDSNLFRPPYGKMTLSQLKQLKKHYKIVYWDTLAIDWENKLTSKECIDNVLKNVEAGSIIVFHDSLKAWPRLKEALPIVLGSLLDDGYNFATLSKI